MHFDAPIDVLVAIIDAVAGLIGDLAGLLPNPDPFPALLDGMTLDAGDAAAIAYYWLDTFFIADAVITAITSWVLLFPVAWLIMTLWRWAKVR